MEHKTVTVGVFVASLGLAPFLGAEFIPRLDEGTIAMQIWRLPSISLEESNRISTTAEQVIKEEFSEVKTVISRTGRAEIATDPMGVEISATYLMLQPGETWRFETKKELIEAIDRAMKANVVGATFSYSQPIELRVSELISGVRSDIAVHIYGDDLVRLKQEADDAPDAARPIGDLRLVRRAAPRRRELSAFVPRCAGGGHEQCLTTTNGGWEPRTSWRRGGASKDATPAGRDGRA